MQIPIQNLPVELLLEVFLIACDANRKLELKTKLAITHTCRHWRDVAIACGSLWAVIYIPNDTEGTWRLVKESYTRSRGLPLTILVSYRNRNGVPPSLWSFLEASFYNIRCLQLPCEFVDLPKVWAPLLEKLSVTEDDYSTEWSVERAVPYDIFGGKTPRLRTVNLDSILINWDSSILQNLTHLQLHNAVIESQKPEEFLLCLANMPDLEHLSVRHLTIVCDSNDPATDLSVKLEFPHLNRLLITEDVETCSLIFRNLVVKHALEVLSIEVTVRAMDDPADLEKVLLFMTDYHRLLNAGTGKRLLTAQSALAFAHKFISGPEAGQDGPLAILLLRFPGRHPSRRWIPLFTSEFLPLKDVHRVVVDEEIQDWMPTYSRMENVQVLKITFNAFQEPMAVFDIFEALMKDISRAEPQFRSCPFGVLWPKLETIIIEGLEFSPIWDHPLSLQGYTVVEALVRCMKVRAQAGFSIRVLNMTIVHDYDADVMASLKEHVGVVNIEHFS